MLLNPKLSSYKSTYSTTRMLMSLKTFGFLLFLKIHMRKKKKTDILF